MDLSCTGSNQFIGLKLAPFNPINVACAVIALEMLEVEKLTADSVLYDLGCGDGRVLIEACKINDGIHTVGIEYDLSLCLRARENIEVENLSLRAIVVHDNVIDTNLKDAAAIFIYLVPEGIKAIRDTLLTVLERGISIVTYVFSIPGLKPLRVESYKGSTKLYLYSKDSL